MPIVNKDQLARELRWSLPTLNDRIARDPAFPVVRRGSNGVAWQFDLDVVRTFAAMRERERLEAIERRRQELDRIIVPHRRPPAAQHRPALEPLQSTRSHPIASAVVVAPLEAFGRSLAELVDQVGRDHGLAPRAIDDLKQRIAERHGAMLAAIAGPSTRAA